ncbi:DUF952 domain-containing protein [Litoreibacter roseus]|uniref:DUF952 domain-containing protein n=1 Tax=Litoreibacter roseus TaxID=2601869 RepID=A0A6N6JI16_9RHOB|nr:DUF952 domain-containing protein [Litoreibacter roseus]GFE65460.1 hypothetical protein KIN_25340 [Litoreibacter roseus]
MQIYKILTADQWATFQHDLKFEGAPIDLTDGYIHFSTASQIAETLAKHFGGQDGLVICAVDTDAVGADLKWEPSRGGDLFPHLYRSLDLAEVVQHGVAPLTGGHHSLPDFVA